MTKPLYTNGASAVLAAGINAAVTSLSVAAGFGALFPSPSTGQHFWGTLTEMVAGTLQVEIVQVTARATDAFTIVRAQQGTAAASFTTAAIFSRYLTASDIGNVAHGYFHQPIASGEWLRQYVGGGSGSTFAALAIRVCPFFFPERMTCQTVQVECMTLAAASLVRLGIWADNGLNRPGVLLDEWGTVVTTSTGLKTISISKTYDAGVYWIGGCSEGGGPVMRDCSGFVLGMPANGASMSTALTSIGGTSPGAGSLPNPFPATSFQTAMMQVALRVA